MYQQTESTTSLPRNYLQFHENAFVSPLNLINVTHPAPVSFGRAPHVLQQILSRATAPSAFVPVQLQSIDTNKLQMYQFLAQRKLKEDRWKQELENKNNIKPTISQRNVRSAQQSKNPPVRSASAPKKPIPIKREAPRSRPPAPIHITRSAEPYSSFSTTKQNEISDLHEQLLVQLRVVHNPPTRENIIDETEQEKQRRIRLKRERIKRDSRVLYNAHQELKQILQDIRQPDVNMSRLIHHHLNAYKVILTAAETLANEAPLKPHDTPVQQLFTSLIPILETLNQTNQALGLSQLHIDSSMLRTPPTKSVSQRAITENRSSPSNHLLPTVYKELLKKKQQRKPRLIPSVLRPRSAESVRLPRADSSTVSRPTISAQHKTRARSHSPLPSIRTRSTIETPFHSRFTVDHILVKLAPRLLANYNGRELTEQIERARTLIPMFLVDNRLTDDEITQRVMQMIVPRQQQAELTTDKYEIFETPEERAQRINVDVYQTQISTWDDEMSQIRQRLQNYRTNRLEEETSARRTVRFQIDPISAIPLPENVEIHAPLFESVPVDIVSQSIEARPAFIQTSSHGAIRLQSLDANKIRQIERYRKDYQSYLNRTESAKSDDFDPCQIINRLSEYLLDEALLSVVNEIELLTVELSQKLVENELLGQEISLADVDKQHRRSIQPATRKRSPSPLNEQYNTSSFEEDFNSESRISRSEDDDNLFQQKKPMEGTGRFTANAFERQILPPRRRSASSSSSSSSPTPKGIIIKPTIIPSNKTNSIHEEINPYSDGDFETSSSTRSKNRRQPIANIVVDDEVDDEEDDNVLISMKTGEKIYSTDFEESKSRPRIISDDDDAADTMRLSARSLSAHQQNSFYSDEDD